MATRSVIARLTAGDDGESYSWEGRYHHWDGYPSGVGVTLIENLLKHGYQFMSDRLIDGEATGWSNINGCDLTLPSAWFDSTKEQVDHVPVSYSARGEGPEPLRTPGIEDDTEFVYVMHEDGYIDVWVRSYILPTARRLERWSYLGVAHDTDSMLKLEQLLISQTAEA